MAEQRKRTYVFNDGSEEEFFFTFFKDKYLCLICGTTVAVPKRHNVERHFKTCHRNFDVNYPPGSALRTEKAHGLKASLDKQRTFFTKPMKKSQNATEALFRAAHFLIKNKKTFSDGEVFKETMMSLLIHYSKIKNMVLKSSLRSPMFSLEQVRWQDECHLCLRT